MRTFDSHTYMYIHIHNLYVIYFIDWVSQLSLSRHVSAAIHKRFLSSNNAVCVPATRESIRTTLLDYLQITTARKCYLLDWISIWQ